MDRPSLTALTAGTQINLFWQWTAVTAKQTAKRDFWSRPLMVGDMGVSGQRYFDIMDWLVERDIPFIFGHEAHETQISSRSRAISVRLFVVVDDNAAVDCLLRFGRCFREEHWAEQTKRPDTVVVDFSY